MLCDINWTKIERLSIWHLDFQHWDTTNTLKLVLALVHSERILKLYQIILHQNLFFISSM